MGLAQNGTADGEPVDDDEVEDDMVVVVGSGVVVFSGWLVSSVGSPSGPIDKVGRPSGGGMMPRGRSAPAIIGTSTNALKSEAQAGPPVVVIVGQASQAAAVFLRDGPQYHKGTNVSLPSTVLVATEFACEYSSVHVCKVCHGPYSQPGYGGELCLDRACLEGSRWYY